MKEKIIQYLENELSPPDKRAFEEALKSDMELQKAFIFQKTHWEKLALLRFNTKAAALLSSYEAIEQDDSHEMMAQTAILKPMPLALSFPLSFRRNRVRFAALAAATLLFLFNYNSLINWLKPSISRTQNPTIVADKPIEIPVTPMPSVAPVIPVLPLPTKPKPTQVATSKSTPSRKIPDAPVEMVEIIKEILPKVGSAKQDDSIFLAHQPQKDTITSKMVIDGSTISLDNMHDFKGDNSLIAKHLAKIDCKNYTVSFVIKADGTLENPQLEKGDTHCEIFLLNQIKTMPLLKNPIYEGKAVDYRYFFTKN